MERIWKNPQKGLKKKSKKTILKVKKNKRSFFSWAKKQNGKIIKIHKGFIKASEATNRKKRSEKITNFFNKDVVFYRRLKKRSIYSISAVLIALFVTVIIGIVLAGSTYAYFSKDLSNPNALINRNNTGTIILSKDGQSLYEKFGAKHRKLLEFNQIPDHMKEAVISAEDKDFYQHNGVSVKGMTRALTVNFKANQIKEGGSSITQQLVKNALLNPRKSYFRKYQEIVLALELERRYSKEDILKMYLNEIYYGEGAWGLEDAAKVYFGKEAKDLNLSEAAMLAGMPKSPSVYSPLQNPGLAKERQKFVLDSMAKEGYITKTESENAYNQKLVYIGQKTEIKAPHFVMYVLDELKNEYGEDFVEKGGLTVYTSLDYGKQKMAEEALKKNLTKFKSQNANNGSLVSMDPKTGEIIAMVGSADWDNPEWGKVNIALTDQQPGSSFKPFAYTVALKKGWTTTTKVKDAPITFPGNPPYSPKNYDNKFRGDVTVRKALANSLNIPAIKALQQAGLDDTIDFSKDAGITTLNERNKYGLSLVLGGGDVRLLDMTTAYGTLADEGIYKKPKSVTKVLDKKGDDITTKQMKKSEKKNVIDSAYSFIMSDILSDNNARKDVFGPNSPLKLTRPAAAKTGTTNDYTDGWTMGYTPNLVTGVWIGNNDNTPMKELPGALGAGHIWHDYMENALKDMPEETFKKPDNVVEKWIWSNGKIASADTKGASREYFVTGTEPKGPVWEQPKEEKKIIPKKEPDPEPKVDTPPVTLPPDPPKQEVPKIPTDTEDNSKKPPAPSPIVTPGPETTLPRKGAKP